MHRQTFTITFDLEGSHCLDESLARAAWKAFTDQFWDARSGFWSPAPRGSVTLQHHHTHEQAPRKASVTWDGGRTERTHE
jgi:hypothetical protein